jgi:thioredoxin reductase
VQLADGKEVSAFAEVLTTGLAARTFHVPGIFATGDVLAGANGRCASAIGGGSAAIDSIHKYLETV